MATQYAPDARRKWGRHHHRVDGQRDAAIGHPLQQAGGHFRSPKRVLPGIQDCWNRKGLISNLGIKKKAFFTLQAFYDKMAGQYP
jgi:hypothetical protein